MKRFGLIFTFVAMVAFVGCSSLVNVSNTAAATSGATCSKALIALNNSHKSGNISLTNTNDLANILTVINAYNGLKNNKEDEAYKKSFVSGMVSGGSGIITTANATSIMNSLLTSTGLSGVNSSNIANNIQTITTIVSLLSALN